MYRAKSLSIALATAALLAAGFIGGCASKPNDAQIVTNLQSQMFADAQLKSASLQVASIDGEVTLKGTVPNDAARYEAYKLATQTSGVKKVNDQMVVDDQSAQANATPPSEASPVPVSSAPAPAAPASAPVRPRAATPRTSPHAKPPASNDAVIENSAALASNQPAAQPGTNPPPAPQPDAQPAPTPAPQPAPAPPPPAAQQVQIDAGADVTIRMIDSIDSSVNQSGEVFHASLDQPLVDANGNTVVPKGADVYVRLTSASSAGKMTGQSQLHLELVKLVYQGQTYPLVSSTYSQVGESRGKDTATKVGAGAAIGAIIGAIAGGGKGAAIGGAAGAGAGGVYQGATKGQQVKIPSETKLDFQLEQPVTVTMQPQSQPLPSNQ